MQVINVIGCPLWRHVRGQVARRHAELAPLGPNDGATLLCEALVQPGITVPVWGADHYLRVPEPERLMRALLCVLTVPTRD